MILGDINGQEGSEESVGVTSKTLAEVKDYYDHHQKIVLELLSQSEEGLYARMRQLTEFRNDFEEEVERIDMASEEDE